MDSLGHQHRAKKLSPEIALHLKWSVKVKQYYQNFSTKILITITHLWGLVSHLGSSRATTTQQLAALAAYHVYFVLIIQSPFYPLENWIALSVFAESY